MDGHLVVPSSQRSRVRSAPLVSPPPSPLRTSFVSHHARTRSISSGPFPSSDPPDILVSDADQRVPPGHTRRHSRLHSRNLSIFFPRPISEVDRPVDEEAPPPSPDHMLIPASHSDGIVHELRPGFTFGGLPKSVSEPNGVRSGVTARRGHHHKHSLSHNFFSFLEPAQLTSFHPTPAPTPPSPHLIPPPDPISRSQSKSPASVASSHSVMQDPKTLSPTGSAATVTACAQFTLGALLWARGQSIGSLACTGLGYWVVFDALGLAGPIIIARQFAAKPSGIPARRATTLLFAQCVYLMFAGIYVAKEAVEHLLLSASVNSHGHGHGGGDGHHHHWGDENPKSLGLRFPVFLIGLVLVSLIATSAIFGQHDVLVNITNKHIHFPFSFLRPYQPASVEHRTRPHRILCNPYALPPILFCLAILGAEMVLDVAHYAPFDLALAALQVIVTAHVAFAACVVLGGVLLQTSPPMMTPSTGGLVGVTSPAGRMEAFWRVVREIERHEHVVHLPAPHVWQVIPPGQPRTVDAPSHSNGHAHSHDHESHVHPSDLTRHGPHRLWLASPTLIITLSPHVRPSLSDTDVLALTKWAHSHVLAAFSRCHSDKDGEGAKVEVTVGVVRG